MPPKVKAAIMPTSEEILQTKKMMEELELKKLTRQDRLMREIKAMDATTEKQKRVIDVLSAEKDDLLNNLSVMQSDQQFLKEEKQATDVAKLFEHGDGLDTEIEEEKKFIMELEAQIRKKSVQIDYHKKNMKGNVTASDFRQLEENHRADRQKSSLESKLHAAQLQLSSTVKENAEIRQKIKVLLQEKSQFNLLFEEMMQKMNKGKKIMSDVAEQSKGQFAQRNEMARKIQVLKERDDADLQKRKAEMQDLVMKKDEDVTLALYKKRVNKVREKLSEGEKETLKMDEARVQKEKHLEEVISIWESLRSVTGLSNSKEVCDLVVKQEQDNLSLFNYNNELRHQLEVLTEKTAELMKEVEDGQMSATFKDEEEDRQVSMLEHKLHKLQEGVTDMNDTFEAACRLFDRLLSKTQTLFGMLRCDMWPLEQLLGDNVEVNQFNYKLFLNLVESKLRILLARYTECRGVFPAVLSMLSAFSITITPKTIKGVTSTKTVLVPDRKIITRPCPTCEEEARKRPFNS